MCKKLLSLLLICLLMLPCFPALAENGKALTCGDYKYTLNDDGTATINKYIGNAKALTVPQEVDGHSVTAIGDQAFSYRKSLTSISIPDSVTSIGANPFTFCDQLIQITVSPDHPTLATIDGVLFEKPTRTLICYPYAFTEKSYAVPQGIQAIGDSAFYCCGSLSEIYIPDSVTSIGDSAFNGCKSLTSFPLPDSVISIGDLVFYNCESLTSIAIPDSIASIGTNPFANCEQLTQITVSPGHPTLTTINGVLFEKTTRTLICYPCAFTAESYAVPQGIQAIGNSAFYDCESLTSISIPTSITSIGDEAFCRCFSLASIAIPNSVTSIGNYVFYDCDSLTSISIPSGVTFIGMRAFKGCDSLTSVTIPGDVTFIGKEAFYNCTPLTSVTIPDSVSSIGEDAFGNCPSLTLTVPRDSYAAEYAKTAGIPYTYPDSLDWLNG